MKTLTSLLFGTAVVFISAGWISDAAVGDQAGLHTDHHPQHVAACERALVKLAEPQHNTWKNRLAAWRCHRA